MSDWIATLLRPLSSQFGCKISEIAVLLFNHKRGPGLLGSLAAFVIAIVFTWKLLRPLPGAPTRNRQKPRHPPSSSRNYSLARTPYSEEVHERELKSNYSDGIEGISSPVELTLGQIVRRKLDGSRKMTCQLLGVILEEKTPEELQEHASVRPSVIEVLLEISKFCDLYLMERVLDDESEERVLLALESAGLFHKGGLIKDKVLFSSIDIGRTSFVRQLEADWHVDTNSEVIFQLARFIRCQLLISQEESQGIAPNVSVSKSLEQYFSCV